jgi:phosphomannomutase
MDRLVFGTDGWRDIIAEKFTFENLSRAAQAYAGYLLDRGQSTVVVGYDTRFLSDRFAGRVAEVMAANGLRVLLSADYLPTPALSFAVKHHGAGGGVMLTASHNPPAYLGFKLKGAYGGTATEAIYQEVSARVQQLTPGDLKPFDARKQQYEVFDIREAYYQQLLGLIDLKTLQGFKGSIMHDAMGGAAAGWLKGFFRYAAVPLKVRELRGKPNPTFYGVNPEPIVQNLALTQRRMSRTDAVFASVTDGDGDRLAAVLPDGSYFNPHQIFAVILNWLYQKGQQGKVVKTFTVSRVVERLAELHQLPLIETPVGFKYIVDAMLEHDVLVGGEESGGIGVKGHLPERDGLANSLLLLEAVAASGLPVAQLFAELERQTAWKHSYDRIDLHLQQASQQAQVFAALKEGPSQFAGRRVTSLETRDGSKFNLEGDAWLLFRASGTEPLLRVYCEASSQAEVAAVLQAARHFVGQAAQV